MSWGIPHTARTAFPIRRGRGASFPHALHELLAVVQLRVVARPMVSVHGFRETSSLVGKHLVGIRLQLSAPV
jgi:hypothetical protein